MKPTIGAGGAKPSAPPALVHGTPIIIIFGATPIDFHNLGAAGAKSPIGHHYREAMNNTHGAPYLSHYGGTFPWSKPLHARDRLFSVHCSSLRIMQIYLKQIAIFFFGQCIWSKCPKTHIKNLVESSAGD